LREKKREKKGKNKTITGQIKESGSRGY